MRSPVSSGPMVASAAAGQHVIEALSFEDRDAEALVIAEHNLLNKQLGSNHPYFITAGQMFGAGKTQMGMHAIDCANLSPAVKDNLLATFPPPSTLVDDYLNSITIRVNFDDFTACDDTYRSGDLGKFLAYALHTAIANIAVHRVDPAAVPKIDAKVWASVPLVLQEVVTAFIGATGRGIFIHWDEVRFFTCALCSS
jgi:hypothetical protein